MLSATDNYLDFREAITAAHRHPAISDIWEKMTLVADFLPMNTLPEATEPFCSFEILKSYEY